jgi:hypothetical protein
VQSIYKVSDYLCGATSVVFIFYLCGATTLSCFISRHSTVAKKKNYNINIYDYVVCVCVSCISYRFQSCIVHGHAKKELPLPDLFIVHGGPFKRLRGISSMSYQ